MGMLELLFGLFWLAIVVLIVMLVGHGLWLLMAAVLRLLTPPTTHKPVTRQGAPDKSSLECPQCGDRLPAAAAACPWCGLSRAVAEENRDIQAAVRQFRRMRDSGQLDDQLAESLLTQIEHRRGQLVETIRPVAALPKQPEVEPSIIEAELIDVVLQPPSEPTEQDRAAAPAPQVRMPEKPSYERPPDEQAIDFEPDIDEHAPDEQAIDFEPAIDEHSIDFEPAAGRRSLSELVAAFMEERNIRWGELVGGLLIVGCSIALVLSLWQQLEQIPYYPFLIFTGVMTVLFGLGLYAHHHWRLAATSRGLLLTAVLLVPLDFLVMAALAKGTWGIYEIATQAISLGVFGFLVLAAVKVLAPHHRLPLTIAVLANSALVLLIAMLSHRTGHVEMLLAVSALPIAVHAVVSVLAMTRLRTLAEFGASDIHEMFITVGVTTFAALVPLAPLLTTTPDAREMIAWLAMFVPLAAAPMAAGGLLVAARTADHPQHAHLATAGTLVGLLASLVMLAALAAAWPRPVPLATAALLDCLLLAAIASRYRMPPLHALAAACAAVFYLVVFHVAWGNLDWRSSDGRTMLTALLDATSGTSMLGLFVLMGLAAETFVRFGRRQDAAFYAAGCAVVAAVSLAIVARQGYTDRADALRAAIVWGVYGVGSLTVNVRWRKAAATYAGLVLTVGATLWALWWRQQEVTLLWPVVLAAEMLACAVAAAAAGGWTLLGTADASESKGGDVDAAFRWPLLLVACVGGVLTAALWAYGSQEGSQWQHPLAGLLLTATAVVAAILLRWPPAAWAASVLALATLAHATTYTLHAYQAAWINPWPIALLAHAAIAWPACWSIAWYRNRRLGDDDASQIEQRPDTLPKAIVEPVAISALLTSTAVLPASLWLYWSDGVMLGALLAGLTLLWLAAAAIYRSMPLMSAAQAVSALTAVAAGNAWLERQEWFTAANGWLHPWALQAWGVALAVVLIAWSIARVALRSNRRAAELFDPQGVAVDRMLLVAVVFGQFLLAAVGVMPGVFAEIAPIRGGVSSAWMEFQTQAGGGGAWLLLTLLGVGIAVRLWHKWQDAEIAVALLTLMTMPVLAAAPFGSQIATASALRWFLALAMLAGSAMLWARDALAQAAGAIGARAATGELARPLAHAVLILTGAAPVLVMSVVVILGMVGGRTPAGPVAGTIWRDFGLTVLYVVPIAMTAIVLVGHALRERSPGYAFAAGLIVQLLTASGYGLHVVLAGAAWQTDNTVRLLQLVTLAIGLWGLIWLATRRHLAVWREQTTRLAPVLMNLQFAMAALGNLLLIAGAFAAAYVVWWPDADWMIAAGGPLGWFALTSLIVAATVRTRQGGRGISPDVVALAGMAVIALTACSVEAAIDAWSHLLGQPAAAWQGEPGRGFRTTLMLGWAAYALGIVLGVWWIVSERKDRLFPSRKRLLDHSVVWVRIIGLLAVGLAIHDAVVHRELLLGAAAVTLASMAGAAMAVWRHRDGWAFTSGLGINLAATFVFLHIEPALHGMMWWVLLAQVNLAASAVVALLWMTARRQMFPLTRRAAASRLLELQVGFTAAGNVGLLLLPAMMLLEQPAASEVGRFGAPAGLVALVLAVWAVAWYVATVTPRWIVHVAAGGACLAALAIACAAYDHNPQPWLAYRTWQAGLLAAGAVVLALRQFVGDIGPSARISLKPFIGLRQPTPDDETDSTPVTALQPAADHPHSASVAAAWIIAIGGFVAVLAVRSGMDEPWRPYWPAGATLGAAMLLAVVAVVLRHGVGVWGSGLLVNVAGSLVWLAWWRDQAGDEAALLLINAGCLAFAATAWMLIGMLRARRVSAADLPHRALANGALLAASLLLLVTVGGGVVADLLQTGWSARHVVTWPTWAVVAVAAAAARVAAAVGIVARVRHGATDASPPALYAVVLAGVLSWLHARQFEPNVLLWHTASAFSGMVLASAVVWLSARYKMRFGVQLSGQSPNEADGSRRTWFFGAQAVLAAAALATSVWITLSFPTVADRLAGPLAVAMLAVAAAVMAVAVRRIEGPGKAWLVAVWPLVLLASVEFGWALLPAAHPLLLWHYRGVTVMIAAAAGLLVFRLLAVAGPLSRLPDCRASLDRVVGLVVVALVASVPTVLAIETFMRWDDALESLTIGLPAVVAVALVLAAMAGGCIAVAVSPRRFAGKSDQAPAGYFGTMAARQACVYAAELFAGLAMLHLWLARPEWFQLGWVRDYWPLMVMAVAFGGAGLARLFEGWRLPVLAEPLARTAMAAPLVPVIGSIVAPSVIGYHGVFFLATVFYGALAMMRGSLLLAGLAVLCGNLGLWFLWDRWEIELFEHPQVWLIPAAVSALLAEYVHRRRLRPEQSVAIRNLALSVIYVSSAADMFIAGLGTNWLLPLVLAVLALLGMLLGIMLRIRSFLYLGVSFLLLVVVTMIWHAAVNLHQTWIWYASGIVLGAMMLALFALFEKRRNDVLAVLERMKQWQ